MITLDEAIEILSRPKTMKGTPQDILEAHDMAITALRQPEIIRCRDCKYWMPYDWMFSEVWKSKNMEDYPENEIGCMYADMSMSATDFCSRAERREVDDERPD